MERKTLYNLLRMNWLNDPSLKVQKWQVEDYRLLTVESLFNRLQQKGVFLDRISFLSLAEDMDTPEELCDDLIDESVPPEVQDQIYLLIFELWRRLVPEKLCLSIFCDELDHQVDLYDRGKIEDPESLQDALGNLEMILNENIDNGGSPQEVFETINNQCANDIESFLYDFIASLIDENDHSYASDLLDIFTPYMQETWWFDFLKARLIVVSDSAQANKLIRQIIKELPSYSDVDFQLEVLSFLVQEGERDTFVAVVKQTVPLLENDDEFYDLLALCADFYRRRDMDKEEREVMEIEQRYIPKTHFDKNNKAVKGLLSVLEKKQG